MDSVLPSPTPTPTKSVSTFTLDTLSNSIEYPRLAPSNNSVSHKSKFVSDFANRLSHNINHARNTLHHTDSTMDITDTSNILNYNSRPHKSLASLPDNPVNKLLSTATNISAEQLASLKAENKQLKRRIDALERKNAQLSADKEDLKDEHLKSEALMMKVRKYKNMNINQSHVIQELKEKIRELAIINDQYQQKQKEHDLQQSPRFSEDTEILISGSKLKPSKSSKTVNVDMAEKEDDVSSTVEKFQTEIKSFMNHIVDIIDKNNSNSQRNDYAEKPEPIKTVDNGDTTKDVKYLQQIKNEIDQLKNTILNSSKQNENEAQNHQPQNQTPPQNQIPLQTQVNSQLHSSVQTNVDLQQPKIQIDQMPRQVQPSTQAQFATNQPQNVSHFPSQQYQYQQFSQPQDIPQDKPKSFPKVDDDIKMVENILLNYVKKKELRKELEDLENDEYVNYIEELSKPAKNRQTSPKPQSYKDFLASNFKNSNKRANNYEKNSELDILKSLRSLGNLDKEDYCWLDEATADFSEDQLNFVYEKLGKDLQETQAQSQKLAQKYFNGNGTSSKSDGRSYEILSDWLGKTNEKRHAYRILGEYLKRSNREPTPHHNDENDTQLIW
ncbi:hypothetical protein DASC09_048310 [Saccharomycopsis crataegensis]|uniref:Death domain-containing protein n=1 Tax=Saccharomycopsis crataegensis TaxID=43959 RepID=A0AAV5QSK4_9ASCO|nr:hypothetical protein DASC09_048310 [Saccharomycopsis crataegensis]